MKFQRLRDLREDHDLKQADVAKLLQTTQEQYSLYERGEREMPMRHFMTLAQYYNVSLDYLAGLISTPHTLYEQKASTKNKISFEDTDSFLLFLKDYLNSKVIAPSTVKTLLERKM